MDKTEYRIRNRIAEKMIHDADLPIKVVEGNALYDGDLDLKTYWDLFQNKSDPMDIAYLSLVNLSSYAARVASYLYEVKELREGGVKKASLLCQILNLELIKESAVAERDFELAAETRDKIKELEDKLREEKCQD